VPVASGAAEVAPGSRVTLGIRPEDLVEPEAGDARIDGRVLVVERLGSESYVYLKASDGGATLVARQSPTTPARIDAPIAVGLLADRAHLFGPGGLALGRRRPGPEPAPAGGPGARATAPGAAARP
jgi:multiple sugar transport system ATP-binding protein